MRNFKRILWVAIAIALVIGLNQVLDYFLYPYSHITVDVHNVEHADYSQLIVGSSHGKCGIDPEVLTEETGLESINAARGSEYPQDVLYLVKDGAQNHDIQRVIYEIDPPYLQVEANETYDYVAFYHEMSLSPVKLEYFMDKMLSADFRTVLMPWYFYRDDLSKMAENAEEKSSEAAQNYETLDSFSSDGQTIRQDGFMAIHNKGYDKGGDPSILWAGGETRQESLQAVYDLAEFCREKDIELDLVITPVPEVTWEKYAESYQAAAEYMQLLADDLGVTLLNYNLSDDPEVPYDMEDFSDYDGHMYEEAAARFTKILAADLSSTEE